MCCNKIRSCNRNDKWVWGTVKHVTLELTTRNTGRWWSSKSYVKMIGKCCREKEKSSGLVMCCVFRSGEREFRGKRMRERCGIFKRQKEEDVTGEVCRCNTCHRLCPVMLCWWCNQSNFSLLSLFHWVCDVSVSILVLRLWAPHPFLPSLISRTILLIPKQNR